MKKIAFAVLGLVVIGLAVYAQNAGTGAGTTGPRYSPQAMTASSALFPIAGSTASNINLTIDCRFQKTVALQVTSKSDDTAGAVAVCYQRSVDGTSYEGASWAALGTATVTGTTLITNLDTLGCGYIKLTYLTNAHASANLTNVALHYGVKLIAP